MESATKRLVERFNQEFIAFSVLLLFMIIVVCLIIILYVKEYKTIKRETKILLPILAVFLIFLSFVLIITDVRYIKDLEYVKKCEFYQIEGEFVGYARSASNGDDLTVTKSWPIVKDSTTNKAVSLNAFNSDQKIGIEIGDHCTMIYLPNTKIAEVVGADD